MGTTELSKQTTEWLDDARAHPRWPEARTALLRFSEDEQLVRTHDFSLGGAGVTGADNSLPRNGSVHLLVVFECGIREFFGELVHTKAQRGGFRLGMRWHDLPRDQADFLVSRYASDGDGFGSVK